MNWTQASWWAKIAVPVVLLTLLMVFKGAAVLAVATPFVAAFIFAYIFHPITCAIRRRLHVGQVLAVIIFYVSLALVLAGLISLLAPALLNEIIDLSSQAPTYAQKVSDSLGDLIARWKLHLPEKMQPYLEPQNLRAMLEQQLQSYLQTQGWQQGATQAVQGLGQVFGSAWVVITFVAGHLFQGVNSVLNFLVTTGLMLVIAFYLLCRWEFYQRQIVRLIPRKMRRHFLEVWRDINRQVSGFLRGQLFIALVVGMLAMLVLALLGVRGAVLLGIVAGLFNLVPYLGPISGIILAVLVSFLDLYPEWGLFGWRALEIVVCFEAIQSFDGMFLSPRVFSKSVEMHPLLVMFALLLGVHLWGIVGAMIAVPVVASLRVIIRKVYFPAAAPLPIGPKRKRSAPRRALKGRKA